MKKRSKYRPKGIMLDPMTWVMSGLRPLSAVDSEAIDLKIKNHSALNTLRLGNATKPTIDTLIAAVNITEALARQRLGDGYMTEIHRGMDALQSVATRGVNTGRFVMTGAEMNVLNMMMDIHDAQLDACTVRQLEEAIHMIKRLLRSGYVRHIPTAAA